MRKHIGLIVILFILLSAAFFIFLLAPRFGDIHLLSTQAADVRRALMAPAITILAGVFVFIQRHCFR